MTVFMKFSNFGVKRSCFWYVTDFIERMLEVWNKYIDSLCAITFNTMNLLDHTCCTFIVNFLDMLESLLNANVLTENFLLLLWFPPIIQEIGLFWHHWRLCKWFTCTSFVSKSAVGSFGQYIYFIELCIWLLHVFFVGIHPATKLVTTEFFIKWT